MPVGTGGTGHPQISVDHLTLSQPERSDYATLILSATQIFIPSYGPAIAWIKYSPDILLTKRKNSFVNKKGTTFDIGIGLLRTCFSIKNITQFISNL